MNIKVVIAVLMIGLVGGSHAQQCYVCEDCEDGNDLSDEFLMSCSGEGTAVPTTSTVSTEPSTSPTAETTETTNSSTDVSITDPTTESTESSSQSSTESSSVASTDPSNEPTTEPSAESTISTTIDISTVTAPDSPITTTSALPSSEGTYTTAEIITVTDPISIPSTTERPTETPIPTVRRSLLRQFNYNCFVIKIEVNGTQQVNRGCVVKSPNYNEMCLKANGNVLPLECRICGTDQCNSSSKIMISIVLLFGSISALLTL